MLSSLYRMYTYRYANKHNDTYVNSDLIFFFSIVVQPKSTELGRRTADDCDGHGTVGRRPEEANR